MDDLLRVSFFDGRLLTADAMRLDQGYWDGRARQLAQAQGAGVHAGLELAFGHTLAGVPTGPATLQPGLGFTTTGAPVLVSEPITFGWMALTRGPVGAVTAATPKPVVRFSGALPPTVAAPPSVEPVASGLHLLWLAPVELAERAGRVVEPAAGDAVDAWRGGVRVELRAMAMPSPSGDTPWARRSCAAWSALTADKSDEIGPDGLAIALLRVNESGGVDWVEPSIAVRVGERGRGARLNRQFQRQLSDMTAAGVATRFPLKKLGFYAIPPFGILPGLTTLADAKAAFAGTNVVVGGVSSPDDRGWQAAEGAAQEATGWALGDGLETLEASQQKTDLTSAPALAPFWAEAARVGVGVESVASRSATLVRVFVPASGSGPLRFAIEPVATALETWTVPAPAAEPVRVEGDWTWNDVEGTALEDVLFSYGPTSNQSRPALLSKHATGAWVGLENSKNNAMLVGRWLLAGAFVALGHRPVISLLPMTPEVANPSALLDITVADVVRNVEWVKWRVGNTLCEELSSGLKNCGLKEAATDATQALLTATSAVTSNIPSDTPLIGLLQALEQDVDRGNADHDATVSQHLGKIAEITLLAERSGLSEETLLARVAEMVPYPTAASTVTRIIADLTWSDITSVGWARQLVSLSATGGTVSEAQAAVRAYRLKSDKTNYDAARKAVRAYLFSGGLGWLGCRSVSALLGAGWSRSTQAGGVLVRDAFTNSVWLASISVSASSLLAQLGAALGGSPSFATSAEWLEDATIKGKLNETDGQAEAARLITVFGKNSATLLFDHAATIAATGLFDARSVKEAARQYIARHDIR